MMVPQAAPLTEEITIQDCRDTWPRVCHPADHLPTLADRMVDVAAILRR